jgi:hypothetical protein
MADDVPDEFAEHAYPDLAAWLRDQREHNQRLRAASGELKEQTTQAILAAERCVLHAKEMAAALEAHGFLTPRKRK